MAFLSSYLTALARILPALTLTTLPAAIWMTSPVRQYLIAYSNPTIQFINSRYKLFRNFNFLVEESNNVSMLVKRIRQLNPSHHLSEVQVGGGEILRQELPIIIF